MSAAASPLRSFPSAVNALVCGASGGIGRAFVRLLVEDPAVSCVFAASRSGAHDNHPRLRALEMDVTDERSLSEAVAQIGAHTPQLDLVINCVGLLHNGERMQPEKQLADVTPESLARSFAVNATGALLLAKHVQPLLPRQSRAVFATLSARVGSIGDNRLGGWYAYRAAKAAQNMITRNLSIELRRRARGIICVALHPGTVDTALSQPFQRGVPDAKLFSPMHAASRLLGVIDRVEPADNGCFFAYDGQPIAW